MERIYYVTGEHSADVVRIKVKAYDIQGAIQNANMHSNYPLSNYSILKVELSNEPTQIINDD